MHSILFEMKILSMVFYNLYLIIFYVFKVNFLLELSNAITSLFNSNSFFTITSDMSRATCNKMHNEPLNFININPVNNVL